jgi:3-hydroxyisobutyrate dehydrogenase-like beta-hydroxyacid dehydrogenase
MPAIGLIGVGYIGKLFLDELVATDYPVTAFDIDESQIEHATDVGATAAETPAEVARKSEVVIMALPGSPEVEATLEGDDGVLAGADEGDLVLDVSTTLPETSIVAEERCADRAVRFVEAPITGGAPREGYHMMIGAAEDNYEAAQEMLDVICADHVRIGETGDATVFKLALQMRYAGHHAIDAEIVEFCRNNGVDPRPFNDFLKMGIWEKYFTHDFSQDIEGLGGLAIWHKDISYARQVSRENGTALPLNGVVHEAYKAIAPRTSEDEGHAATLIRYWELLNDAAAHDD